MLRLTFGWPPESALITTKQVIGLATLEPIEGRDTDAVQVARLILLSQGKSPANNHDTQALLDLPLRQFRKAGADVFAILNDLTPTEYTDEGGAVVGEYTVRPLRGEDLMMLGRLVAGSPGASIPGLVARLTGLTDDAVRELPVRDYLALSAAVDFLGQDALRDEPSSGSP